MKPTILLASASLFLSSTSSVMAQLAPLTIQQLNFGTFCTGASGGVLTISPEGARTATGDIIPIDKGGTSCTPAIIEVDAPMGTRITVVNSNIQLRGSNGGQMTFHINGSYPSSPLTTTAPNTNISIGGTLTVGSTAANPAGKYSGLFYVTFMVE